jgi:hypothetical protein
MRGPINVKSPNNITNWRMRFNSAFKGLMYIKRRTRSRHQIEVTLYIYNPQPFSLDLQPDNVLLEAETCRAVSRYK